MEVSNISMIDDQRCSAKDLEEILKKLPLKIDGSNLKLNATMGLGGVVYIRPIVGRVKEITFGEKGVKLDLSENNFGQSLTLYFQNQRYNLWFY